MNIAIIVALFASFLPWLSGNWLGGDAVSYNSFGFYTSYIGIAVFIMMLASLLITLVPLFGGPIILKRQQKEIVRLFLALLTTVLLLAALSVLMQVTYEFARMEIRFGIYIEIIASIVVLIYTFMRWQEFRHAGNPDQFHHPEAPVMHSERPESIIPPPPPPPPPPPLSPEEHRHLR